MPEDTTALQVQAQTRGRWVCWYGHATEHYWGTPRPPYPRFGGVVEAETPEELFKRMGEIHVKYAPGRRP
ncbi:hypothetical protein [Actinomadura sp. 9N215]|uniref:hypothetical protein n=1 Tax=Actinomadura sp. 9N215 TaxID=3375150 RepID=UPI0037A445BF